jgi:hypothetical protein
VAGEPQGKRGHRSENGGEGHFAQRAARLREENALK